MLATFAPADSTTLVAANGVYGERAARMLAAQARPHRLLQHDWTAPVDVTALAAALADDRSITHAVVVHHETTTGRLNDLDAIGEVCRRRGVTLLLDAVSSFGAERIEAEAWNLGALAGTANKCLHGAPGLSFVLASRALWRRDPSTVRSVYLDLRPYHAGQHGEGYSPFTLPVQVAFALHEALAEHADQGGAPARLTLFRSRAQRIAQTLRTAGATTLLGPADYSSVLWSWRLPPGMTYAALHDALKSEGYVIYAGQGRFGADVFRIAHMGDITHAQMDGLCTALARIVGGAS
jgi:2-aminoethylphosphonate-pyruvate transaminase